MEHITYLKQKKIEAEQAAMLQVEEAKNRSSYVGS